MTEQMDRWVEILEGYLDTQEYKPGEAEEYLMRSVHDFMREAEALSATRPTHHSDGSKRELLSNGDKGHVPRSFNYLNAAEQSHFDAVCDYAAMDAVALKPVQWTRDDYFEGGFLSLEQWINVYNSKVAAWFTLTELRSAGVSLSFLPVIRDIRLEEQDKGGERWVRPVAEVEGSTLVGTWYRYTDGYEAFSNPGIQRIYPGTVLDELRKRIKSLADSYGWSLKEAGDFLCMGHVPRPDPVQINFHSILIHLSPIPSDISQASNYKHVASIPNTIGLTVPAWLPPKRVMEIYRLVQNQLHGRPAFAKSEKRSGARESGGRPLTIEKITLFRFVLWERFWGDCIRSWTLAQRQSICRKWNESHPEWQYKELRLFTRDYARAERQLLFPDKGSSVNSTED